ncbi:MAG: choice-of-anchor L domain-containing protein, partial [Flavobacteriales bacterium]
MRIFYTLLFCCLFSLPAFSQLTVDQPYTIEQYVSEVLIGNGVTATNITYTGSEEQIGYLSGAEGLFSVNSGLVLSTDHATHLSDPGCMDTQFCAGCQGLGNDQDLLDVANSVPPLIGQTFSVGSVNDLCILEFDFEAGGDSISFNYVFGSDEYLQWVNSTYNDIFAFFLSGPGITGPYDAPLGFPDGAINIASVPDSDPLLPVTISSVNNVTNAAYYIDNPSNNGICINGYTETFTASASVQCGEVYHIKLAIADGSDNALESFVVLEEGSFSSNALDIVADASLEGAEIFLGDTTVVEGCNDAVFTVIRPDDTLQDTIYLNVYGTATMGGDFSSVFSIVIMEPGQSSADVSLGVINDNVNEDPEWVTVEYEYINDCGDTIVTSATIVILDPEPITL